MDEWESSPCCVAGQYGIPRPWYFPFTRTYWCGEKENLSLSSSLSKKGNAEGSYSSTSIMFSMLFCLTF